MFSVSEPSISSSCPVNARSTVDGLGPADVGMESLPDGSLLKSTGVAPVPLFTLTSTVPLKPKLDGMPTSVTVPLASSAVNFREPPISLMSARPSCTFDSLTPMPPAPLESLAPTPAKICAWLTPSSRTFTCTV